MSVITRTLPWIILGLVGATGLMAVLHPDWVDAKLLIAGLLFAGPILMVWSSCVQCSATRRLHHWQTVWQIATVVLVTFALPHDTTTIVYPSIALALVLVCAVKTLQGSLFVPILIKDNYAFFEKTSIGLGFIVAVVDIAISLETNTDTRSPAFAYLCAGLACVVIVGWRWALWYWGADNELSKEQHRDIWPHQQNTGRKADVWWPLLMYARHNDPQPALNLLPAPVLLDVLDMPQLLVILERCEGIDSRPLFDKTRQTLNEKDPRAIAFWELYDEQEAIAQLRALFANNIAPQEAWELPAL